MWCNLSAAQGNEDAAKLRDLISEKMTSAQVAEAQRLASEWKPKPKKRMHEIRTANTLKR